MKQITEDYVSYKIAKLLKEKGFNEPCIGFYNPIDGCFFEASMRKSWDYNRHGSINAPTHQMALKWLREVHNIFIEINISIDLNGDYHYNYSILDKECKYIKRFNGYYSSYESCVEAALLFVLKNLI